MTAMPAPPSDAYWSARAALRQARYDKLDNRMIAQLTEAYDDAAAEIGAEITRLIDRYARRYGMSMKDAVTILREPATREQYRRLKKLVAALEESPAKYSIRARLNAPSFRYRISNLEALRESANAVCAKLGSTELKLGQKVLRDIGQEAYMRTAYDLQSGLEMGWNTSGISERRLKLILRQNWSGAPYSQRVWGNVQKLSNRLNKSISSGLMAGKDQEQIIRELMADFGVGRRAAARLVFTESAFVANQAELESYVDSGVEEYQFVAVFDEKTSEVCREQSGKVFRVEDAVPGENVPPLHPWCRSTTIPVTSRGWLETVRRAVQDRGGKIVQIPATWSYARWEQWQAEGCPPIGA
jgi:SPP1 gp7 family putative phage head morphogenesis protein